MGKNMQAGIARMGRIGLALMTALALVLSVVILLAGPAQADHIPETGPVPSNCVKFDYPETGTKSPPDFPGVSITLDAWADTPHDPHTVKFTISGLGAGQWVEIGTKSGTNPGEESGPYLNGSHSFTSELQQAISHVTLCVFEPATTTTTTEETTTTTEETTTTTEPEETTTTTEATTTTSEPEETTTTIEDEVLGEVVTTTQPEETTTTVEDEVLSEQLPFTGIENEGLAIMAAALTTLGLLVTLSARRIEE
jgi:hypothetical protein